jgi:hypothetical protein
MEEEPEIQEPTSVEEQLNTETSKPTKLNKNGKPRKQLSPEALERLAKAREKANVMRQQAYAKKLEEKVEKIKIKNDEVLPKKELKEEPEEKELKEEHEEVEIVKEKPKSKPKGKKKTKIIVEQSSEDSDEFEPNDNVVFVKRVSRKKKEQPVVEPVKEPEPQMELPPPEPPKPPRPELTPQQRLLKSQYEGMFGGGFMNNNLMRRHY